MTTAPTPNGKLTANIKEAERYTGINRIPLQELVKGGKLTNFGCNTRFRVSWLELETYIKGQAA
jgi:hypothetical protein